MKQGTPILLQDFIDDSRHSLRGAWRAVEGVDLRTSSSKLAKHSLSCLLPIMRTSLSGCQVHTLNVETASWGTGFLLCVPSVIDAHAGKFKMRPMFPSRVGMRGCVL
eukprot:70310-Pelagomonas_calceolata.AAC.1